MYDPAFSGFYLQNSSGAPINDRAVFPGDGIAQCPGELHPGAWGMDQFFTDFRNASAAAWFVRPLRSGLMLGPCLCALPFTSPSLRQAVCPSEGSS